MGAELPGPWGGFALVLALGLPLAVPFAIAAARRPWGAVPMMATVFLAGVAALLAAWWLVWPALLWLNRWLATH